MRELSLAALIEPEPDATSSVMASSQGAAEIVTQWLVPLEPPKFAGFGDLHSPKEFVDRLESLCALNSVKTEARLTHLVPAALEGSAELWLRFKGEVRQLGTIRCVLYERVHADRPKEMTERGTLTANSAL